MAPCDVHFNHIEASGNDLGGEVPYVGWVVGQLDREAQALLKTLLQRGNLFRVEGEATNDRFTLSLSRLKQRQVLWARAGGPSAPSHDQHPDHAGQRYASELIADCSHQLPPFKYRRDGSVNTSREATAQKPGRRLESCERGRS